jgi:hypothetical protein
MRIQGYNPTTDEEMTTSPIKKYDRDLLIRIGNQPLSVFSVPESFLELAKEAGATSPTRQLVSFFKQFENGKVFFIYDLMKTGAAYRTSKRSCSTLVPWKF